MLNQAGPNRCRVACRVFLKCADCWGPHFAVDGHTCCSQLAVVLGGCVQRRQQGWLGTDFSVRCGTGMECNWSLFWRAPTSGLASLMPLRAQAAGPGHAQPAARPLQQAVCSAQQGHDQRWPGRGQGGHCAATYSGGQIQMTGVLLIPPQEAA